VWRCPHEPCTQVVTLITELVDPSTGPLTVATQIQVSATPTTPKQQLAPEALTFVERDAAQFRAAPSVVRGEVSGQDTIGPGNPVVEHRIAVHRDPGVVTDPSRFVLDGRLQVESSDPTASIVVNLGAPDLDRVRSERSLERPIEQDLPIPASCSINTACDIEYVVRLKAGGRLAAPSILRWRVALAMTDYDATKAPRGRSFTAALKGSTDIGSAPVTLRRTARGHYDATQDRGPQFPYVIALDPAITMLPDGQPRPLLVSQIMTIGGVEATGPESHLRPPFWIRFGRIGDSAVGEFSADGQAHTFRRYELEPCTRQCETTFGFDVFFPGADVAKPVSLDWTLEVEVTAWGGPALPSDAQFGLRVLPPVP